MSGEIEVDGCLSNKSNDDDLVMCLRIEKKVVCHLFVYNVPV